SSQWQIVFVPISMRIDTDRPEHYLHALADQLASIARQALPSHPANAASYYGDRVFDLATQLLHGRSHVLIVLDGLDESLGADFDAGIFPQILPSHIRIVAAARPIFGHTDSTGWAHHLSWDSPHACERMDLKHLDEAAIRDVMRRSEPRLNSFADTPTIVSKLYMLSEGEPFVLRYYVEYIRDSFSEHVDGAHVLRALGEFRPGFGGYFGTWLKRQGRVWNQATPTASRQVIDAMLITLACALGPLQATDLRALLSFQGAPLHGRPVERWLEDTLARFVIGNGKHGSGYILSHPRIGEYLKDDYLQSHAADTEVAFVTWGQCEVERVNSAQSAGRPPSPYLVSFYRRHLERSAAPIDDFMRLVENGWREAWQTQDRAHHGFAADVHSVWSRLQHHPESARILAYSLRCTLVLSSINSLAIALPPEILLASVEHGLLSDYQAEQLARSMRVREDTIYVDATLLCRYQTDPAVVHARLIRMIRYSEANSEPWSRRSQLEAIARCLSDHPRCAVPDELIQAARDATTLLLLLKRPLHPQQREQCLERAEKDLAANRKQHHYAREWIELASLVDDERRSRFLERAAVAIDAMVGLREQVARRCEVLPLLDESGRQAMLDDLQRLVANAATPDVTTLVSVVRVLVGAPRHELETKTLNLALGLPDSERVGALIELLPELHEELRDIATTEIRSLQERSIPSNAATYIGWLDFIADDERRALSGRILASASEIDFAPTRSRFLRRLARHVSEPLRTKALEASLAAALEIRVHDDGMLQRELSELAPFLGRQQLRAALDAAMSISDGEVRAQIILEASRHVGLPLREALQSAGYRQSVLAAQSVGDKVRRVVALVEAAGV
ncbi:MAG: hypothetical protein RL701_2949, partial [Pseudomonadota bacterium]